MVVADAVALVEHMVRAGLAVREGDVVKVTGGSKTGGKGKGPAITDADKKVLDFRLRGGRLSRGIGQGG